MKRNLSNTRRIIRTIIGAVLIGSVLMGWIGWWGWIGVVFLVTGILGVSPLNLVLGRDLEDVD